MHAREQLIRAYDLQRRNRGLRNPRHPRHAQAQSGHIRDHAPELAPLGGLGKHRVLSLYRVGRSAPYVTGMKRNDVWFVTGASKGIGLVLVQSLLARGYRVAATSRSLDELTRLLGPKSERFLPIEVDLRNEASVQRSVVATHAHFGALHVVVNN